MSQFFSSKYNRLTPYTPGEQPKDQQYVKLNTNESPYPPSPKAIAAAEKAAASLQLYSDPECRDLVQKAADVFGVASDEILFTNGSDEILNFAFMAFCDKEHPAIFPDITYGFYPVFAALNNVPFAEMPLNDDFTIRVSDYVNCGKTVFIANPNAPTGIALPLADIRAIVESNPNNVVIVDEAYVDFGAESAVSLIHQYHNLLVTQTFSKSRSMAGARLGVGFACSDLIRDLNTVKYSTNPYNVNRMTMAAGIGALEDAEYFTNNCQQIMKTREWTTDKLINLGFSVIPSSANFVFAKHKKVGGKYIYTKLKERGILVRYFDKEKLRDYNRITIGDPKQMETLISTLSNLLEEVI